MRPTTHRTQLLQNKIMLSKADTDRQAVNFFLPARKQTSLRTRFSKTITIVLINKRNFIIGKKKRQKDAGYF